MLLDVRTAGEVADGRIGDALNVDVRGDGFDEGVEGLSREEPVFTYCRSGRRSARAAARLRELGFKRVYDLQGGITAWKKAGFPVTPGE